MRLVAYLAFAAVGVVLITLGTLCSRDAWLAAGNGAAGATASNANPFNAAALDRERRIDYVLVGTPKLGGVGHVVDARLAGNAPVHGLWPSDHLAVVAELRY